LRTVLLIDDDPVILELLSAYLGAEGFRPVTARDGRAGLAAFDAERPDAVLCDLGMPGLGGLGVLAEVRRRSPLTPFVVFSGTSDLGLAVEALRQGAWDYLLKPLPDLALLPALLGRLEERALLLREKELYQSRLEAEVKQRTAELVRELGEKDVLLAEVHHRVKNNLQIIQVILSLQHEHSADPQVRSALDAAQNRIHTLAMVQEAMHDGVRATLVDARQYAEGIVLHLLSAYDLTTGVDFLLDGDAVGLTPGLAFTFGLVANELLAALAFRGRPAGPWRLAVTLNRLGPAGVELVMADSRGVWADWVPAPARPSLGWDLVSALAAQHKGELVWNQEYPGIITVRLR
jgi:two-component sensor histidine kinase